MSKRKFRIGVTGDTGVNVYTEYVKGFESLDKRVKMREAALDFAVPSGAGFTASALKVLFGEKSSIHVEHLLPKSALHSRQPFSSLVKFLVELDKFGKDRILRVRRTRPIDDDIPPHLDPEVFHQIVTCSDTKPNPNEIDLLVVHDGAGSWRRYPRHASGNASSDSVDAMELVKKVLAKDGEWPRVLVNLNYDLPTVERTNKSRELQFPEDLTFWRTLYKHKDRVCVICSVNMLRREGAAISRRLSWEQTMEDLAADLTLFDKLKILSRFRHLIVRFGIVGAAHIHTDSRGRTADLVFAPLAKTGFYRDPVEDGTVESQGILLAAALAKMIASQDSKSRPRRAFVDAMKTGLLSCMRAFDVGYKVFWNTNGKRSVKSGEKLISDLCEPVAPIIQKGYSDAIKGSIEHTLGEAIVPCGVLDRPPAISNRASNWEILRNAINPAVRANDDFDPQYSDGTDISRINIGTAIVKFGSQAVLNRSWSNNEMDQSVRTVLARPPCRVSPEETHDYITLPHGRKPVLPSGPVGVAPMGASSYPATPIYAPVMTFSKLVVVEREEIESLRSIRNLLKGYIEDTGRGAKSLQPISIAVFGPPGSGKSFTVKQIASDINATLDVTLNDPGRGFEPIEYNVAQFRSVEELGDAITRASVINNEGKTPLVFFDEFDCGFSGQSLGWLKYFLAPMQDGTFHAAKQTIKIAKAVFVFAGGIYHNFELFDPFSDSSARQANEREYEEVVARQRQFRDQKGPDFISRLRGHINILPISVNEGEIKPIIRRAIILRGLVEHRGLSIKVGDNDTALIDEDVIYALLTVDHYRHGTRSMEAILQMCSAIDGRIEKASLPPRAQLNMHVDADEFFIRVYRGRFRPPTPATQFDTTHSEPVPAPGENPRADDKPQAPGATDDVANGGDAEPPHGEKGNLDQDIDPDMSSDEKPTD